MVRYTGRVPVTLCTPLDHQHSLLPKVIAKQVVDMMTESLGRKGCSVGSRRGSTLEPTRTAVVVLSHGDGCEHFWRHLHESINAHVLKRTSVKFCEGLYVQTLRSPKVVACVMYTLVGWR